MGRVRGMPTREQLDPLRLGAFARNPLDCGFAALCAAGMDVSRMRGGGGR